MLTRRQLLGGLFACIPLVITTKVNKEDIEKVSAKYRPYNTVTTAISVKKTQLFLVEYENEKPANIAWRAGVKFELLSVLFGKDGTTDIEIYERVNNRLNFRVRIINVNLSDFNIETCSTSSIDWSQINKENYKIVELGYGQV